MRSGPWKALLFLASLLLLLLLPPGNQPARGSGMDVVKMTSSKSEAGKKEKAVEIPEHLDEKQIDALLAGMDDEQVRRLLIAELKKSAASAEESKQSELSGFSQLVTEIDAIAADLREKLDEIRSGALAAPKHLPKTLVQLHGQAGVSGTLLTLVGLLSLLVAGASAEWLFRQYIKRLRAKIESACPSTWWEKSKDLLLCFCIDLTSIGIFLIANAIIFIIFFGHGEYVHFRRLLLVTYLAVVLLVRVIALVANFILAPGLSKLRLVGMSDDAARYLHRWVWVIAGSAGMGLLLTAIMELQRVSEATLVLVSATTGMVVVLLIMFFAWKNRLAVARMILQGAEQDLRYKKLLRVQLADYWHLLTIPYLLMIWGIWVLIVLVDQDDLLVAMLALMLSVPLYILLDWIGQKALDATLGLVHPSSGATGEVSDVDAGEEAEACHKKDNEGKDDDTNLPIERFIPTLRHCLSFSIAGIVLFWLLKLWGFDIKIGETITHAALKIVVVILFSYVIWKLVENAINRRLAKIEHPQTDDEEEEMGGAGGSRIGTLLRLLRKTLLMVLLVMVSLIILSAIGVNIGPLLAGAGIVGLAIGFGSQTLVKDIVSGIFFLIDDAFRLGDYVESGQVKGTVENISIRSLRLRHSRGMIYTVPFGHLGSVTNYSRDYLIDKIEFRVPYGTDINKVRKIIKKINEEIEQDEVLAARLLAPIKSQGVKALDDSGIIMRIKFKTRPGDQFVIRREIFLRLHKSFEKSGIQFAHRQVIVQLPQEKPPAPPAPGESAGAAPAPADKQILSAGAAAAIAMALAEEEEQGKKHESK
jgi:moderate conductance mechanosensitive channel